MSTRRIVTERHPRRLDCLKLRRRSGAHMALVLILSSGKYEVVPPDQRLTAGELFWKPIRTVYDVDLGEQDATLEAELPSAGDAFGFVAVVDLRWQIQQPEPLIRRHVVDTDGVLRALRPVLLQRMRQVTRRFDVTASAEAEDALRAEFDRAPVADDLGVAVRVFVRLAQETATRDHASSMIMVERQTEIEVSEHQLHVLQETNRSLLVEMRAIRFREAIAAGDIEQFAIQIAENPDDIGSVMDAVRADRDLGRQHAIEFFTRLSDSGLIERYEVDDVVRTTLDWLRESVTKVIPDKAPHDLPGGRRRVPNQPVIPPVPNSPGSVNGAVVNGAPVRSDNGSTPPKSPAVGD